MSRFAKFRSHFVLIPLLLITFFSYSPVLQGQFLERGDNIHLLENSSIRHLDQDHLQEVFTSRVGKSYMPLTSLSFALEHHFFGYDPFVYHLNNLLLHLLIVVCVFQLALSLGLSVWGAGVASLIFALHPIHVEPVAWITARKDLLSAFFYILALLSYQRYLISSGKKLYGVLFLTTILGVLSLLANPAVLSLPGILLLLDWFHRKRIDRRDFLEKIPIFVFFVMIASMTSPAYIGGLGRGFGEGLLVCIWIFIFYLRQFLFPWVSVPIWPLPEPVALLNFEYCVSGIAFLGILVAIFRARTYRWAVLIFAFYVFSVFPLLFYGNLADASIVADRFMYLPSLGFCLALGLVFENGERYFKKDKSRWGFLVGFLVIITGLFSFQTYRQAKVWQNGASLWEHQLKIFPDEPVAMNHLANFLKNTSVYQESIERYGEFHPLSLEEKKAYFENFADHIHRVHRLIKLYEDAATSDPDYFPARYNQGNLYHDLNMLREAQSAYEETLRIDPSHMESHFRLAELYQRQGDIERAVGMYKRISELDPNNEEIYVSLTIACQEAFELDPDRIQYKELRETSLESYQKIIARSPNAKNLFKLAWLYNRVGRYQEAMITYQEVLKIHPNYGDALYNLGNLYKDFGQLKEAIGLYQKCIAVNPKKVAVYLNLGNVYGRQGRYEKASEVYRKAIAMDPQNGKSHFSLGYAQMFLGRFGEAIAAFQKALEFAPSNADIFYHLGNAYVQLQMSEDAISYYKKAVEVDSSYLEAWANLSVLSFQQGNWFDAVRYCKQAMALGYQPPADYWNALAPYWE